MVHWVPVLADSQTTVGLRLKTMVSLDSKSDRPRYGVVGSDLPSLAGARELFSTLSLEKRVQMGTGTAGCPAERVGGTLHVAVFPRK